MNKKKIILGSIIMLVLFSCSEKYGDVIEFMDRVTEINNTYADGAAAAGDVEQVIVEMEWAINGYNKACDFYYELPGKYPELQYSNGKSHPEELNDAYDRQKESLDKIKGSFAFIEKYMPNDKIVLAIGKLLEAVDNTQKIVRN